MDMRSIKTDRQYRRCLAEVSKLVAKDPSPKTAEGARLELLAKLVEAYEKVRFPFEKPDAEEAIQFRMEQQSLRPQTF